MNSKTLCEVQFLTRVKDLLYMADTTAVESTQWQKEAKLLHDEAVTLLTGIDAPEAQ